LEKAIMFKLREKRSTFFDAAYICEKLIPGDSLYRKFRKIIGWEQRRAKQTS
jgi:hypothetical protein